MKKKMNKKKRIMKKKANRFFPLNDPFMSQVVINTHVNRYAKAHWTTKA